MQKQGLNPLESGLICNLDKDKIEFLACLNPLESGLICNWKAELRKVFFSLQSQSPWIGSDL